MRAALLSGARTALLAGPTVLAFFSGGYFDGPRAWAGLIAWALVAIALVAAAVGDADALVLRAPDGDRAARVHPIPFVRPA